MTMRGADLRGLVTLMVQAVGLLAVAFLRGERDRVLLDILVAVERTVWAIIAQRADRIDPVSGAFPCRHVRRSCTRGPREARGTTALARRIRRIRMAMRDPDGCARRLVAWRRRMMAAEAAMPDGETDLPTSDAPRAPLAAAAPTAPDTS